MNPYMCLKRNRHKQSAIMIRNLMMAPLALVLACRPFLRIVRIHTMVLRIIRAHAVKTNDPNDLIIQL